MIPEASQSLTQDVLEAGTVGKAPSLRLSIQLLTLPQVSGADCLSITTLPGWAQTLLQETLGLYELN